MNQQTNIFHGTKAIVVFTNGTPGAKFQARLYVNCRGATLGDATTVAKKFKSMEGARTWALKTLAAYSRAASLWTRT